MNICVKLVFLGALAETLGLREEQLALPIHINTLASLRAGLMTRGEAWQALAADNLRMAINHQIAKDSQTLQNGDEIAFFPPVTGG